MKITKQNKVIKAAEDSGTTYYRIGLEQARDALADGDSNLFSQYSFDQKGWEAIDFTNSLFGSRVIDDVLYLCETNGEDILVDGELIDPEAALDEVDILQLAPYIVDADDEVIVKHLTEYEIEIPDMTQAAIDLLSEGHTFKELFSAAEKLDW